MSMTWVQYLLGKLAEEASEVAKEAMKCQQQGVASPWKGRAAIFELRNEIVEMLAVAQTLGDQNSVSDALGPYSMIPQQSDDVDDDIYDIKYSKIDRMCYYAMFAYKSGNLTLTIPEWNFVRAAAIRYGAQNNMAYIGDISFRG
jgi:hypothetical protein